MLPYVLGAFLLSALSVSADSKHDCYYRRLDQTTIKDNLGWFQCKNTQERDGGAQLCCKNGDRCGDDGICHTDKIDQSLSSFYIGGCSDGKYEDSICKTACSQFKQTWIQWNHTAHIWDCCGDYDCDQNYTSVSFKAKSPAEWEPIPQNDNFKPDGDDHSDDGGIELSTAAKAGIGVGAGVAVIAVIALIAVCCIRRRKPADRKTFGGSQKGTYARLGPQHEMTTYPGGQGMPRSRDVSPARGVSPSRAPMMSNYGDVQPPNAAAQAATYPDHLAVQRSTDDGA